MLKLIRRLDLWGNDTFWRYFRAFCICVGFGVLLGGVVIIADAYDASSATGHARGIAYVVLGALLAWIAGATS